MLRWSLALLTVLAFVYAVFPYLTRSDVRSLEARTDTSGHQLWYADSGRGYSLSPHRGGQREDGEVVRAWTWRGDTARPYEPLSDWGLVAVLAGTSAAAYAVSRPTTRARAFRRRS
ncbi:hypothetical protein VV02_18150 [Luteipulveratus mongoliensis]|uniref:Uncharacterized protein n=1 Tax=Luteipulveratus mongoliensis TaxID=571913 RepID=A0A0K1JL78_9MICO|nr:hypothetical protein VV02_18150 [Luteipulveratus mongoliensis]